MWCVRLPLTRYRSLKVVVRDKMTSPHRRVSLRLVCSDGVAPLDGRRYVFCEVNLSQVLSGARESQGGVGLEGKLFSSDGSPNGRLLYRGKATLMHPPPCSAARALCAVHYIIYPAFGLHARIDLSFHFSDTCNVCNEDGSSRWKSLLTSTASNTSNSCCACVRCRMPFPFSVDATSLLLQEQQQQ